MLRKLIVLAITSGLIKKVWARYAGQGAMRSSSSGIRRR